MMRRVAAVVLLLGCAASVQAQGRLTQDLTSITCPGTGCLVQFAVNGQAGMSIQVSGTFVGTLVTEASVEGSVWVSWPVFSANATDNTQALTSLSAPGLWFGATSGLYQVRVRMSAYTSGTARVAVQLSTTAPGSWVLPPVVPPSSVLSDALSNPTTRTTGAYLLAWDATNSVWRRVQVDAATGTLKVDPGTVTVTGTIATTPPANASTNITQIGGSALTIGQQLAAASIPVILPAATVTALTPPAAVTVTQATGTNLHTVVDSAPTTAVTNAGLTNLDVALSTRLKPADTLTKVTTVDTITNPVAVTGTFFQATQPVSAASLPLPTNAAQESGNLATIVTNTKRRGASSPAAMVLATNIDTLLLAANAGRVTWRVCNQSRSPLLVKFGTGATEFSYNVRVAPRACYEDSSYTGVVDGVWFIGADNYAMVSESS